MQELSTQQGRTHHRRVRVLHEGACSPCGKAQCFHHLVRRCAWRCCEASKQRTPVRRQHGVLCCRRLIQGCNAMHNKEFQHKRWKQQWAKCAAYAHSKNLPLVLHFSVLQNS